MTDPPAPAAEAEEFLPNSRRVNANAVHINGAATGASPVDPPCNHANRPRPIPLTTPVDANARGAAFITGAWDADAVAAITGVTAAGAGAAFFAAGSAWRTTGSTTTAEPRTPLDAFGAGTGSD